jgi:hypothetical protein
MNTQNRLIRPGLIHSLALALAVAACSPDASGTATGASLAAPEAGAGLLNGRVTAVDGTVYQGRLRFGKDEEALWGNYFNGYRADNPWLARVPRHQQPRERMEFLAVRLPFERRSEVGRPFMARFGDIRRIDARGRDLRITLRSGTVVHLDRYAADDFADGVRVWDRSRGVVDLGERRIRSIEFLPTPGAGAPTAALFGTVRTARGTFTGLIQWDRVSSLRSDELYGYATANPHLRFEAIRTIERQSDRSARVSLADGGQVTVSTLRGDGNGDRGLYVDDPRYGRVLVSWNAFERVDFTPGGAARGYGDFSPGQPLAGTVTTNSGRRVTGRLVFDLDESETTETLDAPSQGVDYTIPFALIASVTRNGAVTLRGGERLQLEPAGDLGASNAGLLVFAPGHPQPAYIPWHDVAAITLASAAAGQP